MKDDHEVRMQRAMIHYVIGDAIQPVHPGPKIICHCCNDLGHWRRGFVLALSKSWPAARVDYSMWFSTGKNFALGEVQFVPVESALWVANLIGQHGIRASKGVLPIRYDALGRGFKRVAAFAVKEHASVHMPRIGCGLAGGSWPNVEALILAMLVAHGVDVFVYDLASR